MSNVRAYVKDNEKLPSAYEQDALIRKEFAFELTNEPSVSDVQQVMAHFESALAMYKCNMPTKFNDAKVVTALVKSAWDQLSSNGGLKGLQCSKSKGLVVFPVLIQEPMYLYKSAELAALMGNQPYMRRGYGEPSKTLDKGEIGVWANIKPKPVDFPEGCCRVHPQGKFCPANSGQYINTNINENNIKEYYRMFVPFSYKSNGAATLFTSAAVMRIDKVDKMKYDFLKYLKDSMTHTQLQMQMPTVKLYIDSVQEATEDKLYQTVSKAKVEFVYGGE